MGDRQNGRKRMAPAKLMMIRHAEKPLGDKPLGVRSMGDADAESLTPRGWQRAGALARFFAPVDGQLSHPALAKPAIIAASRVEKHGASRRPKQTVKPLAHLIGIDIDERFGKGHEAAMMADLLRRDGVVLIAWEHEHIPALVAAMPSPPAIPQRWPDDRFDLVWVFDADGNGGWRFTQVPQLLLAGDVAAPAPMQ